MYGYCAIVYICSIPAAACFSTGASFGGRTEVKSSGFGGGADVKSSGFGGGAEVKSSDPGDIFGAAASGVDFAALASGTGNGFLSNSKGQLK